MFLRSLDSGVLRVRACFPRDLSWRSQGSSPIPLTLPCCPGSSHILTPTRFLDDLKTLDQKLEDIALP